MMKISFGHLPLFTASLILMAVLPLSGQLHAEQPEQKNAHHKSVASIEQLLGGLKERLEKEPNDVKGWVLLARSYQHLGMQQDAEAAAKQAESLGFSGKILSAAKASPKASAAMPNDHHHQAARAKGAGGSDAGTYVSSFFDSIDEPKAAVSTEPNSDNEASGSTSNAAEPQNKPHYKPKY